MLNPNYVEESIEMVVDMHDQKVILVMEKKWKEIVDTR